jgi:AcrR family transcriptional regulator
MRYSSHKRIDVNGQDTKERVAQKQRTRHALLVAARELLAAGGKPTVPEVADHANISRATAYRYFSTPEVLAQEAILDAVALEFERLAALLPTRADPAQSAEDMVAAVVRMVLANEALFRTFLSLANTGNGLPTRGGRRVRWLSVALEPLADRLPQEAFERLVHALSLLAGIETVIVLKDVCGLNPDAMENTVRWMARALVAASLEDR